MAFASREQCMGGIIMRADMPDFRNYSNYSPGKIASMINFFLGIWVLISPFALGFSGFKQIMLNNVIVGVVVICVSAVQAWGESRTEGLSWVNLILGLWLIVTAFVFDVQGTPAVVWNQIICGSIVAILAAVSVFSSATAEPPTMS
jgi:hypothetical protein